MTGSLKLQIFPQKAYLTKQAEIQQKTARQKAIPRERDIAGPAAVRQNVRRNLRRLGAAVNPGAHAG
jgi:hypothetical protein